MQHTATQCNTLHHDLADVEILYCNTLRHTDFLEQLIATHYNAHLTAARCNTLRLDSADVEFIK